MKNTTDLILGEVVYIAIIYHIPDSWINLFEPLRFFVSHQLGWLFNNETRTRPPTCKIKPWTSYVYEIEGNKGFLAVFQGKSSLKWRIYAEIPTKLLDLCFILCILCVFLWITWFFVNYAIGCDLKSIVRNHIIE